MAQRLRVREITNEGGASLRQELVTVENNRTIVVAILRAARAYVDADFSL